MRLLAREQGLGEDQRPKQGSPLPTPPNTATRIEELRMTREEILQLHPDPQIANEVAIDLLSAQLDDCRSVLRTAESLNVVSPKGVHFKENCRRVLERTD